MSVSVLGKLCRLETCKSVSEVALRSSNSRACNSKRGLGESKPTSDCSGGSFVSSGCCPDDSLGNSDLRVCVMLRQPRGNQDAKVSTSEEKPGGLPTSVSGPCDAEEVFGGAKTPESPLLKRNLDDSKRPCLYLMNFWEAQNSEHVALRKPWRLKTKNVCSSQEVS